MHHIKQAKHVPFSAEEMYSLVNNINEYPKFLPWCTDSNIVSQKDHEVIAKISATLGGFQKSFTTKNSLYPYTLIEMTLVEGPFRTLEGYWRFTPQPDEGCLIEFELSFEIENRFLALFVSPLFEKATMMMVDTFCQQAAKQFGTHEC